MMRLFKKIIKYTIILGVIGFCLNMIFDNAIGFLQIERYNGVLIYRYDYFSYMENLRQSFTGTTELTLELPTRIWQNTNANMINEEFWEVMGNNLALIFDYLIFALNILLWPLRLMAYFLRGVLAIIGLNVISPQESTLKWLIDLVNNMVNFIQIPYV